MSTKELVATCEDLLQEGEKLQTMDLATTVGINRFKTWLSTVEDFVTELQYEVNKPKNIHP